MNLLHVFVRFRSGLASRGRNIWFRLLGTEIHGYVWLRRVSIPRQWGDIRLGAGVALDDGVALVCSGDPSPAKLTIGERTYVNRNTILMATEQVIIGADCLIGPNCYITDTDHGVAAGELMRTQALRTRPVVIGNGVWLGANVVVLKGVTIGNGAIIAAGAVVTADVAADTIAMGVPARSVGLRK
jgi:carbonic anhydrase/acetyltransferase-like protein (isoleucine patch superfamily)